MKYARLVKLTAFSYEHENNDAVLEAFLRFFPFNLDENKVAFSKTHASGFNERKICILEAILAKNSLISQFLKSLLSNLDETQRKLILVQAESRLDKKLNFFLRFGKDLWVNEGKLALTDSGKCFHIRISVAAFPKKREIALNVVKQLFS